MHCETPHTKHYIGIDVCKDWLDIHIRLAGGSRGVDLQVSNTRQGHKKIIRNIGDITVDLIVIEATGKWQRGIHHMLHEADYKVAVVNPYRSRKLADVVGQLAKTDKIDARLLALFAERIQPEVTPPNSMAMEELAELVALRRGNIAERTATKNRLGTLTIKMARRHLKTRLDLLEQQIKELEVEISLYIKRDPVLSSSYEFILSIPGVGPVTAMTLVADMPELGQCSRTEIAALAGLAPMNWDSGNMRGKRRIKGGRHHIRTTLYMAALAAIRCDKTLKAFYQQLIERGKMKKVAIIAVMRKMIILANTLVAQKRMWHSEPPHKTA